MKTSEAGISLIRRFEGVKLEAYPDPATGGDPWTIGVGHTSMAGPPKVKPGMKITAQQADDILRADLVVFEQGVMRALKRDIPQPCFDACVSLAFNIGVGAFAKSSVCREIRKGNLEKAASRFGLWVKANGKTMRGLVRRRAAEAELFMTGVSKDREPVVIAKSETISIDKGKSLTASTTNIAAGVSAAAGVTAATKQIVEDTTSIAAMAPWLICAVVVAAAAGWIIWERYRKSIEDGV